MLMALDSLSGSWMMCRIIQSSPIFITREVPRTVVMVLSTIEVHTLTALFPNVSFMLAMPARLTLKLSTKFGEYCMFIWPS